MTPEPLEWCEDCKSQHTSSLAPFHGRVIYAADITASRLLEDQAIKAVVGLYPGVPHYIELATRAESPKPRRRWWQFWRAG